MITKLHIENFKSLKNVTINTKELNLLMGLNGMGKSSLIQVLLLLMQSRKLENNILELNEVLTKIGTGKDAFYQFSNDADESIVLEIITGQEVFRWDFTYSADKEELVSSTKLSKEKINQFRTSLDHHKLQYISADRLGPVNIYELNSVVVGDKKQIGLRCEYTAHFIDYWGDKLNVSEALKHKNCLSLKLSQQLNAWLKEISPGVLLNTIADQARKTVSLDYQFELGYGKTNNFRPTNVGYGITYTLPVVLSLLTAEEGKMIVIENPEAHIHPRGQAEMGKLIASAAQAGAQLFIETHSDHILNGIRAAVKEERVHKDKVNIFFFDKKTTDTEQYSTITEIKIDRNGSLSEYPDNFLDEWSNQLSKLI
jgi:predicted ATPase